MCHAALLCEGFVPGEVVLLIVRGEMAAAEDGWCMQGG